MAGTGKSTHRPISGPWRLPAAGKFRYKTDSLGVNANFISFRDPQGSRTEGFGMSIRRDIRAIGRGAAARPGAALILAILLLTRP
jgi:hypothetical protein